MQGARVGEEVRSGCGEGRRGGGGGGGCEGEEVKEEKEAEDAERGRMGHRGEGDWLGEQEWGSGGCCVGA